MFPERTTEPTPPPSMTMAPSLDIMATTTTHITVSSERPEEVRMQFRIFAAFTVALVLFAAAAPAPAVPPGVTGGAYADGALATAVNSADRSAQFTARDKYRHPRESLSFWGLKPGMTVLEIWPSGGYWTEILAPYTKATNGKYIAATQSAKRPLPAKFTDKTKYGDITQTVFDEKSGPLAAPGSVDLLLTSRNIHDWMDTAGMPEKAFRDFYAAVKPGGILAVEQHRADPKPMAKDASDG